MTHRTSARHSPAVFAAALAAGAFAGGLALHASAAEDFSAEPPDAAFDTAAVKELAEKGSKLSVDERVGLIRRLKRDLSRTLLTVPESAWAGWDDLRSGTQGGLTRLVERGLFEEGLLIPRGSGCYWSFTKRSHSYNEHPQIELQQWRFSSGFYGGAFGLVRRLEAKNVRDVSESSVPSPLAGTLEEARKVGGNSSGETRETAVGDVYAVRAVSSGEFDVLAAFQVIAKDDLGVTIAWRVLKQWDVPPR
jgi:hypothetical protein